MNHMMGVHVDVEGNVQQKKQDDTAVILDTSELYTNSEMSVFECENDSDVKYEMSGNFRYMENWRDGQDNDVGGN